MTATVVPFWPLAKPAAAAAIVVDVTFATDHPGVEKKELGDHKLGGGPVLAPAPPDQHGGHCFGD